VIEDLLIPEVLSVFQPATTDEIAFILNRSQAKQCQLDPVPTWLGKRAGEILAPVIAHMCNTSFQQSRKSLTQESQKYISKHNLLPVFQLAWRPFHSTETAVICVVNSMLSAMDQGHVGALMLLDLSVAFDTVDHGILIDVMQHHFRVCSSALE